MLNIAQSVLGPLNSRKMCYDDVHNIIMNEINHSFEKWATYSRGSVRRMWIVLYFPQSFIKSFSLVWFSIPVLVLLISEEVFCCKKGSTLETEKPRDH